MRENNGHWNVYKCTFCGAYERYITDKERRCRECGHTLGWNYRMDTSEKVAVVLKTPARFIVSLARRVTQNE